MSTQTILALCPGFDGLNLSFGRLVVGYGFRGLLKIRMMSRFQTRAQKRSEYGLRTRELENIDPPYSMRRMAMYTQTSSAHTMRVHGDHIHPCHV